MTVSPIPSQTQDDEECIEVSAKNGGKKYRIRVPRSDLRLRVGAVRYPAHRVGIPDLSKYYKKATPGVVIAFGPYAYAIAQIQRNDTRDGYGTASYNGSCDSIEISGAAVWPYKYDSLSTGLHGIVRQLEVLESLAV